MPGPSDWDIKIIAQVPPETLTQWIPANIEAVANPQTDWPQPLAKEIDVSHIDQWYEQPGKSVGIDRKNSVVVFRINTLGM